MTTRCIALRRRNTGEVFEVVVSTKTSIVIFNVENAKSKPVPIPGASNLYGIAFDKTGRFLIVVDRRVKGKPDGSKFHVLDAADNYKTVFTSPINNPSGVAIAPNGQIYIYNEGIQIYDLATDGTCTKSEKSINKTISCPTGSTDKTTGGIAFDMLGNIVVSNNIPSGTGGNNSSIRIISPAGDTLGTFVCKRKDATLCNLPDNIAFDKNCKHLIVTGENHVRVFNYENFKLTEVALQNTDLNNPQGIALSNHGEIYVCDHKDAANQIKIVSFDQSSSA